MRKREAGGVFEGDVSERSMEWEFGHSAVRVWGSVFLRSESCRLRGRFRRAGSPSLRSLPRMAVMSRRRARAEERGARLPFFGGGGPVRNRNGPGRQIRPGIAARNSPDGSPLGSWVDVEGCTRSGPREGGRPIGPTDRHSRLLELTHRGVSHPLELVENSPDFVARTVRGWVCVTFILSGTLPVDHEPRVRPPRPHDPPQAPRHASGSFCQERARIGKRAIGGYSGKRQLELTNVSPGQLRQEVREWHLRTPQM